MHILLTPPQSTAQSERPASPSGLVSSLLVAHMEATQRASSPGAARSSLLSSNAAGGAVRGSLHRAQPARGTTIKVVSSGPRMGSAEGLIPMVAVHR